MTMRVMIIVRASKDSEAGRMPSDEVLAQMRKFNDEVSAAGVLVGMGGLQPSATGKRVKSSGGKRIILDGPFTETKELIAGYAIWEVASMDEALAWIARFPDTGEDDEIEIRPMYADGPCGTMYTEERKAAAAE
jgi:hypothetical protein